jgi:uncharacterized membrane protein
MQARVNVAGIERVASGLVGVGLATYGLKHRSMEGTLLASAGAALIARGMTGHCPVYRATGVDTSNRRGTREALGGGRGRRVEESVTINDTPSRLFAFWRNFENLPRFMDALVSVQQLDDRRSHWVTRGPAGRKVEWDAEIINEVDGELIGWRTLDGADVISAGSVRFTDAGPGRGTAVTVKLQYDPPGGKAGSALAWMMGREPSQTIGQALRRLKMLMETGEIATTAGQPRGQQSMLNYD